LHVFALPSLTPVLVHELAASVKVVGLGADPAGRSLIVCDETRQAMVTLAWPLQGMPARAAAAADSTALRYEKSD